MAEYFKFYWRCFKWAYWRWERMEAMTTTALSYVFALVCAVITGITQNLWFLFMLSPFLVMGLFVAPYKLWKADHDELERMKEKRLLVSLVPNYEPGDGSHWLRLRVDNLSALPIPNCFGKLDSYTMLIKGKRATEIPGGAKLNDGLPPDRHSFPWGSTNTPDSLKTIEGNGHEYLYIAVVQDQGQNFFTPTEMGLRYPKTKIHAEYEVIIDIGSEKEAFTPSKVRLCYEMGNRELNAKSLELLN